MFNPKRVLLYAFLLDMLLVPTLGRKFQGHSYPKSSGLSGLSKSGGHAYPPSRGLSGGTNTFPLSGGEPSRSVYPASGASHSNGHPQNNFHMPPHTISYTAVRGGPPVRYPAAYLGQPPTYVHQYKRSGSKYGPLIAGLALLNLGTIGAAAYSASKQAKAPYQPEPGQVCKFGVKKENGDYEETIIDCHIISSFILKDQARLRTKGSNTTTLATRGPLTPVVDNVLYAMLPNGVLVPVNSTALQVRNPVMDPLVTNTANTTLVNALDVKGEAVKVTPGMECFVSSTSPTHLMKRSVPCDILQTYASSSPGQLRNFSAHNRPMFTVSDVIMSSFFYFFHRCFMVLDCEKM